MPEFELDEESVSRGEKLSSRLMDDLRRVSEKGAEPEMRRELFSEQRYSDQADGVPINDVLADVGQLAVEFAAARRWHGEVPCLKLDDGTLAPISFSEFFGGPLWLSYGSADWFELWDRYFGLPFPPGGFWREILRRSGPEEQVRITNLEEAEGGLKRNLGGFLSYRFAGMKRWGEWIQGRYGISRSKLPSGGTPPPPAVGPGGGMQVQVSCLTPGLRIHISPAYFITWVYFGSPTTPVAGYVLPGRYVFAGDGPMQPRRKKDPAVFCIPADYHPTLTRF
jgi:hypothetical protein